MSAMRLLLILTILLAAGCKEGADLGECPPSSDAQQLAGRQVVILRCQNCHDSSKTGAARQDAPDDLNYDDLAVVRAEAESMYGSVLEGEMPPDGRLSDTDTENVRIWLACGAQDVQPPTP